MLYDNAQLLGLYLDAWLVSGKQEFANAARDIIRYLLRDMTDPEGGFYSAKMPTAKQGRASSIAGLAKSSQNFSRRKNSMCNEIFRSHGKWNFVDHSDPNPLPKQNVLSIDHPKIALKDEPLLNPQRRRFLRPVQNACASPRRQVLASWNGSCSGRWPGGVALDDPKLSRLPKRI